MLTVFVLACVLAPLLVVALVFSYLHGGRQEALHTLVAFGLALLVLVVVTALSFVFISLGVWLGIPA